MEDAAIHLAMAKGLFSEGFFSLTSGVPAGAVTSPLWIVLEAIPLALFGSITAATTFMTLLTAGCLMGTLWLLFSQDSPWQWRRWPWHARLNKQKSLRERAEGPCQRAITQFALIRSP